MADRVNEHRIKSWAQLVDRVALYRRGWIFRGEGNPKNEALIPVVGRSKDAPGHRRLPYSREDEQRAFYEFKQAARPYVTHEPKSEIEWLAIAQHYGVPTRMLDWTESLLVAAFFAVEKSGALGNDEVGHAVIYAVKGIHPVQLEKGEPSAKQDPFDLSEVRTYSPPHISPRIPAQRSIFTIHPDPTASFTYPTLERWVIYGKSLAWDIKLNLNASGINEGSLYPDLTGLCKSIAWRFKWGFFQDTAVRDKS